MIVIAHLELKGIKQYDVRWLPLCPKRDAEMILRSLYPLAYSIAA